MISKRSLLKLSLFGCLVSILLGQGTCPIVPPGPITLPITARDLGSLGTGTPSEPHAINDLWQVVGSSKTDTGETHAFIWDPITEMRDLGTLGGSESVAWDINDLGRVVGESRTATGETRAFLWDSIAGMQDLGTLGGMNSSAQAINELDQVAGWSEMSGGETHAFLWDPDAGILDLGTLGGGVSRAFGIDDSGQVVGSSTIATGEVHAFLWEPVSGMGDLGTLGGTSSGAWEINAAGHVVGASFTPLGEQHAFLWKPNQAMQDLGVLTEGAESHASAINDVGQVVGSSAGRAFVWESERGMVDLNTLLSPVSLWRLFRAADVNENGLIAAVGQYAGEPPVAVLVSVERAYGWRTEVWGQGLVTKDPDLVTYEPGTSVKLTAFPAAGWEFERWEGDAAGAQNPITVTMDSSKTVRAVFSQKAVEGVKYYYVALTGSDDNNGLSEETPVQSIQLAINRASAYFTTSQNRATVLVGPGLYESEAAIQVKSGVNLMGQGKENTLLRVTSPGETEYVAVYLEPNSALDGFAIELPGTISQSPAILVSMGNTGIIRLTNCRMDASENVTVNSIGVRVTGGTASTFLIADCEIVGVTTGIQTLNSGVNIARNLIQSTAGDGILVEAGAAVPKQAEPAVPLLGDAEDPDNTGLNRFRDVGGLALNNTTDVPVQSEANDWDAYSEPEIEPEVNGPAVWRDNYIGKALVQGTIVVSVLDEASQVIPQTGNPSASIPALSLPGVWDSESSTFHIAGVPDGQHTVEASATGFVTNSEPVTVVKSSVEPVSINLAQETPPPPPCGGGKEARIAYAGCILVLWVAGKRRRAARA